MSLVALAALVGPVTAEPDGPAEHARPGATEEPASTDERTEPDLSGEPAEPTESTEPAAPQVTAPPGQESGRVDPVDESPSTARLIGRSLLFVPRTALDVVALPVRGSLWLVDRYQLPARFNRFFFDDTMTIGLYPTAQVDSGFGLNVGTRFVDRNVFGQREHFSIRGNTGGRFRGRVSADFSTGHRLGRRIQLMAGAETEQRPKDAFYGIGNETMGIDGRHRQSLLRARSAIDFRVVDDLHARVAAAVSSLRYAPSDEGSGVPINDVYDTSMLVGWNGVNNNYTELELRWDSRRQANEWDAPSLTSAGWYLGAYAGYMQQRNELSDYWRYGSDLQHFARLGTGPRVLVTRVHGELVSPGDVAFTELPELGGASLLRGYPADRFRDRVATVGSIEYQWDLVRHVAASLFVDVGRVYGGLDQLTLDDMRLGYGLALQIQSTKSFIAEASLASSIDGGIFMNLSFDPVFRVSPREERR